MDIIELERWKPSEEDPRKREYSGQPTAAEVFAELKHRLESTGYLPDEYFELDFRWEDGKEIPRDADIFCAVDYGGSEGIYVDVYLKWYDKARNQNVTNNFITGKTLGETGDDLDRMFLIASAITKAFHGDRATHDRYVRVGGPEKDAGGRTVHLSQEEEKVVIEALVEQRERQGRAMSRTEQLLRRMTGSITSYMDTVGRLPLRLSDYDRTVLAVRDGELSAFKELYPKVMADHAGELLVEAAGRPGPIGLQMTLLVLESGKRFTEPAYRAACEKAIGIDDPRKVSFLLEQADGYVEGLPPSFRGEMASYAYCDHLFIAREIVKGCTEAQVAAAPPRLLEQFAMGPDYRMMSVLVRKGISGKGSAANTLHMLTYGGHASWIAEDLLKERMWVDTDDYGAFHACVQNDAVEVSKLLLDGGMDFDGYRKWAEARHCTGHEDTLRALAEHWSKLQAEQHKDDASRVPETDRKKPMDSRKEET